MTLPPFAIAGGLPLALARGLSVAGLFSVFGAMLARVAVLPAAPDGSAPGLAAVLRRWRILVWSSLVVAVLALATWTWLIAGTLANAPTLVDTATAASILLQGTDFGHALLLQFAALGLIALALAFGRHRIAAGLAAAAVVLEAAHGHAFAMNPGPSWLLLSTGLHLLAGAAWLGGLLPLLLMIQGAPVPAAARACRRFAPLGAACVLILAATAGFQFWVLIGSLPRLLGTAYGLVALAKIVIFLALLGFAAVNRLRLTPALAGYAPERARYQMGRSIAGEAALGLLIVLAAGVLASLPPAMHVPAVWPLPFRPSLTIVRESIGARREVIGAGLALGGTVALLVFAALVRPPVRWIAVAAAGILALFAVPHLGPLFVPASRHTEQYSPTKFAATGKVQGALLSGSEGNGYARTPS